MATIGQKPARTLRLGWQQRRPLRRFRAGRRPAHRPRPAAAVDSRQPRHLHAAPRLPRPQGPRRPPGQPGQPAARTPQAGLPRRVGLFADIDSQISLTFLDRFDCQDRADWLSPKRLAAWLASVGYCGRTDRAVLHARLTSAPRGAIGEDGAAETHVTRTLLTVLRTVSEQIKALSVPIDEQLTLHADAHIFTSLPRAGRVRAARLFAEIGACRARFPTPESLACLAGVAPSTRHLARPAPSASAGQATNNSATPSLTSSATPDTPTHGPPTSTTVPSPAAMTTPMRTNPRPGMALRRLALLARQHGL